ncbi:MAG: AmmeMemoRadiSam system protein B [Acidobacteriota bacterium]|nr:AmmeMemoRadiSam system protein B [Acidobacteriota bacterium]
MPAFTKGRPGSFGLLLALILGTTGAAMGDTDRIRPPAVAGKFYSDEAPALEAGIRAYLDDAVPGGETAPAVLVAPHAGYIYSGQIAADAWAQARGHDYDVIVLLGTHHTAPGFSGISVFQGAGYRTPLGIARLDTSLAAHLLEVGGDAVTFRPEVHRREHSVEVQVPFAQILFPDVPLLPAVVGAVDPGRAGRLGTLLARSLAHRKALVVASSDLSHYPTAEAAREIDAQTLLALVSGDPVDLHRRIRERMQRGEPGLVTCACGRGPLLVALAAAREMGARKARVLSYAHSGWTAMGKPSRVVGYGAAAFYPGPGEASSEALDLPRPGDDAGVLGADERRILLNLARETLHRVMESATAPLARNLPTRLWTRQGAFVTLHRNRRLRGCIGHMAEDRPLFQVVQAMAIQAAFDDPRFSPVTLEELKDITIEISVLTPFKTVDSPEAIRVGRDGVRLDKEGRRAVFLPQVAPEQGWDRVQTLDHLCRKAGLPVGCWRQGARLSTFQAQVFSEDGDSDSPAAAPG